MFAGGSGLVVVICLGGYLLLLLGWVFRRSGRDRVRLGGMESSRRRLMSEIDRHSRGV